MAYGVGNLVEKDTIYRVPIPTNDAWAVRKVQAPGFLPFFLLLVVMLVAAYLVRRRS